MLHHQLKATTSVSLQSLSRPRPVCSLLTLCLIFSPADATIGGTVKLTSSDPFSNPEINPNYVSTDFDLFTLVHSVKTIKKFISGSAWKDIIIGPYDETWGGETDDEIVEYIRANAATIFHGTGTAAASAKCAVYGVVDPDLTVKNVEGISVADVSVIVSPNCVHTFCVVF